jgi:hypothetical protein
MNAGALNAVRRRLLHMMKQLSFKGRVLMIYWDSFELTPVVGHTCILMGHVEGTRDRRQLDGSL